MSDGQPEDESSGGPTRASKWRLGSRLTFGVGVALAFAVGLIVGIRVSGSTQAAPAPTSSTGPSPTASAPTPKGPVTNVLLPGSRTGGSRAADDGVGVFTFWASLINNGDRPLTPVGPVQLLAPDGTRVIGATASLAAYDPGHAALTPFAPPPETIAPHGGKIMIVVSTLYDCDRDRYKAEWPDTYPRFVIPLQGYKQPATYDFSDLFYGDSYYGRMCAGAATAAPAAS